MSTHGRLLPEYLQLRKKGMNLSHKLVKTLGKDVIDEGGRKLGIMRDGVLVFDSMDQSSVLMDYCIYNVYRGGRNAVERMLADSPPADPDELVLLEAMSRAHYSIFQVEDVESGVGVTFHDALRLSTIFMIDVGMGNSLRKGFGMAGRVIPMDGYYMSGGAMLPLDGRAATRFERDLHRWSSPGTKLARLTPTQEAELAALAIRACLDSGMGEHIVYSAPGEDERPGRRSPEPPARIRANPNDRCPCGSGRKYKSCCGKR